MRNSEDEIGKEEKSSEGILSSWLLQWAIGALKDFIEGTSELS